MKRTKFQEWLRQNGACLAGRRAVGRKTYAEFWRTCERADWLKWILDHAGAQPQCDYSKRPEDCPGCKWGTDSNTLSADEIRAKYPRPEIEGLR